MLGYKSPDEWSKVDKPFTKAFVDEKSQGILVTAYQNAMEKKIGSTIKVAWKKKSGSIVSSTVILVPIVIDGHLMALHFISGK